MSYSSGRVNAHNCLLRERHLQKTTDWQGKYKCLGVDLDNTLHDFKSASRVAMKAIYAYLEKKAKVDLPQLDETYKKILKEAESNGFTENISRTEYRKRRFTKLLEESEVSPEYVEDLLKIYEDKFIENLRAYSDMTDFLEEVHETLGLAVVVISEGPKDAQEITLQQLGIRNLVDKLFTASEEGTSKTENLFSVVLQKLEYRPSEVFYIGDSQERDIDPAQKVGIHTALFEPDKQAAPQIKKFSQALIISQSDIKN